VQAEAGSARRHRARRDRPAGAHRPHAAATVRVDLETIEVLGNLDDGTTYRYWTFNGKVPGPFVRVRVGDTVEVGLRTTKTAGCPTMSTSMRSPACTAAGMPPWPIRARPKGFTFKALNPGLYVYHCAVHPAAQHISNGMYGLILVEPEGGLPEVDREFYVMQGELYTDEAFGTTGELTEATTS
jgi:nitrite reductase (NO-forming)